MILGTLLLHPDIDKAKQVSISFFEDPDEKKIMEYLQEGGESMEGLLKKFGQSVVVKAMGLSNMVAEYEITRKKHERI